LQSLIAPVGSKYYLTETEAGDKAIQETDTFDTWYSSGQWPYSTLGWEPDGKNSPDFDYFYPTSVLDTMWDILFFWVARMIMMGIYVTGKVPFKMAHMHSRVVDKHGVKMSKSKGNVINPITIVDQYGADALRMALVYGIAPGSDIPLSDDKIRAQRNFVNKIWNASRFVLMIIDRLQPEKVSTQIDNEKINEDDKEILRKLEEIVKSTTKNMNGYKFGQASEDLYQFFWHEFCDIYIEKTKDRGVEVVPVLLTVLITSLKLLHPFIPFVTESVYQEVKKIVKLPEERLIISNWPN
jgi:valyl-tRNA synthetase